MNIYLREKIENQLFELGCMSDFAAELATGFDREGAGPGFFRIELDAGERLAFCCIDIQRRIEALQDTLTCA
jgi:hypothetical protein